MTPKLRIYLALPLLMLASILPMNAWAQNTERMYVTPDGSDNGSGWNNPANLSDALANPGNATEIWVAEGEYFPENIAGNGADDRDKAFVIPAGITLYGGFPVGATALEQRDWENNKTILSGENTDSYHVVIMALKGTETATLDGFHITGGMADGGEDITVNDIEIDPSEGAGIWASGKVFLSNNTIRDNTANKEGGGVYVSDPENVSPSLAGNTISGNRAGIGGGVRASGAVFLSGNTIRNNTAESEGGGGGVYASGSVSLAGNTIEDNTAEDEGGGVHAYGSVSLVGNTVRGNEVYGFGGGVYAYGPVSLTGNIFYNNTASAFGGAVYAEHDVSLTNNTAYNNTAGDDNEGGGSGFYVDGDVSLANNILWANTTGGELYVSSSSVTSSNNLIGGTINGSDATSLINNGTDNLIGSGYDPLFVDAANGDFQLKPGSPAIDAGNNSAYETAAGMDPAGGFDFEGNPRLAGNAIDMGAYEHQPGTPPSPGIYHTVTLKVAPGMASDYQPGQLTIVDGDHLFLQFWGDPRTVTADDVLFLIDGVETAFKNNNGHFSYILSPIHANHTVLIALRHYPVTLPEVESATTDPVAGVHWVSYGEPFNFILSLNALNAFENIKVYANGSELMPQETGQAQSRQYTIDAVSGPVDITIEGADPVSNAHIVECKVNVIVESGKLRVDNSLAAPADITVYAITGQVIATRRVHTSETIPLSPGLYLVRTPETVHKVVIR